MLPLTTLPSDVVVWSAPFTCAITGRAETSRRNKQAGSIMLRPRHGNVVRIRILPVICFGIPQFRRGPMHLQKWRTARPLTLIAATRRDRRLQPTSQLNDLFPENAGIRSLLLPYTEASGSTWRFLSRNRHANTDSSVRIRSRHDFGEGLTGRKGSPVRHGI